VLKHTNIYYYSQPPQSQHVSQLFSQLPPRSTPQTSSQSILSLTAFPQTFHSNNPLKNFISAIPNYQSNQSVHNNSSNFSNNISQLTNITLDPQRIPKYNGQLSPVHPVDFLDKVNQYFLKHNAPDHVKINFVSDNFTGKVLLWYTTLLPPPLVYSDFVTSFQDYFWSNSLQRSIRNDLYRPHYHRDTSTMSEHTMDWINRARHLQPPIDQMEMVDQITSHFSYNIALALRGLRILTTNDLIKQLTYLQRANSPTNNSNNNINLNNNAT